MAKAHRSVTGVHRVSEAERPAYADRDKYVADTDFVPLPGGTRDTLLNQRYLQGRARLIDLRASMRTASRASWARCRSASTRRWSSTAPATSASSTATATS